MEKIVTHPLYIRCKKVIESCDNKNQIEMARRYCEIASQKISNNFYKKKHMFWEFNNFNLNLWEYFGELYSMACKKQLELERLNGIK